MYLLPWVICCVLHACHDSIADPRSLDASRKRPRKESARFHLPQCFRAALPVRFLCSPVLLVFPYPQTYDWSPPHTMSQTEAESMTLANLDLEAQQGFSVLSEVWALHYWTGNAISAMRMDSAAGRSSRCHPHRGFGAILRGGASHRETVMEGD